MSGTVLVNQQSAIALPLLPFYCGFEQGVVSGHFGVLACLVSVLSFDEWFLGNFRGLWAAHVTHSTEEEHRR